jgi:signal transduction histidine kinase
MVSWGVFDWVLAPQHFWLFLWLRLAAAGCALLLAYGVALRTHNHKTILYAWWGWCLIWNLAIGVMLMYVSNDPLPFVVGACLCMFGPGLLPVWSAKYTLTNEIAQSAALVAGLYFGGASTENLLTAAIAFGTMAAIVTVVAVFRIRVRQDLFNTQRQLEDANRQLQELDTARRQLFHNVSHELRTPLTLIISPVTEMLRRSGPSGEAEALRVVLRNAKRLLRMIDDLLDLAKLEAGGLRLRVRDLDVGRLARGVVENARPAAAAQGIDMTFAADGKQPVMYGDAHRIEIILTNLVGNALKFTPEGGNIGVRVEYRPGSTSVRVTDTGPGVPRDQQEKIFQRFHQTDASERRKAGGVGIGLALARDLAELHGGKLSVESVPGHGSTFTLDLPAGREHFADEVLERREMDVDIHPARRAEDASTTHDAVHMENAAVRISQSERPSSRLVLDRGRVPRLLVAEDKDDLRGFIVGVLKPHYVVDAAADGAQALELLEQNRPDLVLTDIMMPGTSGLDLCRTIKGDPSLQHIPVILLTARGEDETALEGYEAGADDFVAKPFHTRVLQARIRAHLKMRGLSLQLADQARLASAGTLAAGLAHEVKNPLNAAVNAVRVIEKGGSSRVSNEKLMEVVVDALARIDGIISALGAHARPADGDDLAPCSVRVAVESTLNLLDHKLRDRVEVHQTYETTGDVYAPARAFNQVLLNLIDNSIQSGGKNIWIEVKEKEGRAFVAVADDGPGVPPDLVQRIFDPFFTTRAEGEGTGLGLHLSRRIAQECGGELRYEPRPGGGARFVMEIPVMEQAA